MYQKCIESAAPCLVLDIIYMVKNSITISSKDFITVPYGNETRAQ